jgi:general stress protein YciG
MNSPRIYVYKITFEEISHYYYGVHKEKKFDEYYMGSPVTHKDFWELYTPKKEIVKIFDYTDNGWLEAQEFEKSLVAPVYNTDSHCLNENCSGVISLENCKKGGNKHKENKTGICGRSPEKMSEDGKKGGKISGKIYGKIVGNKHKENKTGIFGRSPEKMSEDSKKGGKTTSSQKWQCTETGYISTACGLTHYQNKRGIDTSKRIKVDGPRGWEITFSYGRVVVTYQTLKDWAEENGYSYSCLLEVRGGRVKNHRGIIKVVPF